MIGDVADLKFTVGNTYKELNTKRKNCHQWRAFIRLEDNDDIKANQLSKLATHCTFHLHESFKTPVRKVDIKSGSNEVSLQMNGWGYF